MYKDINRTRQGYAMHPQIGGSFFKVRQMKRKYSKEPTSISEQIAILKERGAVINDDKAAQKILEHISYYRLSAYRLPFELDHSTHQLRPGTSLELILSLYDLDRHLRLLVLDAIERFEVSVRAQWANHLSKAHGSHAHLEKALHREDWWEENIASLKKDVERAKDKELFIEHLSETYSETLPPIWAVSEVISFGLLSKWFKSINDYRLKKDMAEVYGISHKVLSSWLEHLSVVRNTCAHHSRLWNRDFSKIRPIQAKVLKDERVESHKIYYTFVILLYLMDIISPKHTWRERLHNLLEKQDFFFLQQMGFPVEWHKRKIWKKTL